MAIASRLSIDSAGSPRGQVRRREPSEAFLGWLLILPGLAIVLGLNLYPITYSFWIALNHVSLLNGSGGFAGLENYATLLADPSVRAAIWHTLIFTVVSLVLQCGIGLSMALVLNEKFVGRGLVRALIFLPWALPTVVNATLWQWIYHPDYGVLSGILYRLGLVHGPVQWLGDPRFAMLMVILADSWKVTPFYAVMFLAALQTIPDELYQAAEMDGAGLWARFRYVTIPFLTSMLLLVLVLRTVEALRVFDIIYVLTGGGPGGATTVLGWLAYEQAFRNLDFSMGAAIANLIVVGAVLIAWFYARLLRRATSVGSA